MNSERFQWLRYFGSGFMAFPLALDLTGSPELVGLREVALVEQNFKFFDQNRLILFLESLGHFFF